MNKINKVVLPLICLLGFLVTPGFASNIHVNSSPEAPCLSIIPGESDQIVYPSAALERKEGGTVEVNLIFDDAESQPKIKINGVLGSDVLWAVRQYVVRYRMPCMKPEDKPFSLRQTYTFNPNDNRQVVSYPRLNETEAKKQTQLDCMVNVGGNYQPDYPRDARLRGSLEEAKFYYKLTFSAPDQAPELEWIAKADEVALQTSIKNYVNELRLPCLTDGPVSTKVFFKFQIDKGARTLLKDMVLKQFVASARSFPAPAKFDLSSMGCPFDLRMTYMQPFDDNDVREYENVVPSRKPFIDWLAKIVLHLNEQQSIAVLGDIFTLKIPCGTIDL